MLGRRRGRGEKLEGRSKEETREGERREEKGKFRLDGEERDT